MDFLEGLSFIHHSRLHYHGRLSTFNCWIDKHFTLKLMHVATDRILGQLETVDNVMDCLGPTYCSWEPLFWLVPKLDAVDQWDSAVRSMQAVDIFSSGLILYDILTAGSLYRKMQDMLGTSTVVSMEHTLDNPLIAAVDFMEIAELASVIHNCLSTFPEDRLSIKQLRSQLRECSPLLAPEMNQYKLFDKIYRQLCLYSNQLELEVILRSRSLRDARRRCDAIVRQYLPKEIADALRAGRLVVPEMFDCVTISFTQLYGFTSLTRDASPEQVITVISKIEDFVDVATGVYDVYKVEAVSDSVLVASGLPNRIGSEHVRRLADFSLLLLQLLPSLSLPEELHLMQGLHSGSCAAGVVGVKRPRYCLFGDTINVASRMCSQGLPGRIHLSCASAALLHEFDDQGYVIELRGLQQIKGRGDMLTYWLSRTSSATPVRHLPT
ncbi:atrial natriuretic peptide receptor 1-like [Paramacrobiotus metropolitanus]|uniref:atrial natriuretic peptide receptor 1-like n=1 Tax=Paramacrobiotus metropolitanus TaxID=2943436 RepID=UPI0024460BD0|nr:atrial natriuretic peptide receptor 1-like [Paramacrobiotus metropolitanus]